MKRIAIVGAGISSLYLARVLDNSLDITLFEKSLFPGGRMATRIHDNLIFNHGAFEIPPLAQDKLSKFSSDKFILWPHKRAYFDGSKLIRNKPVQTIVGKPHSNAVACSLASGLRIHYDSIVTSLQYRDSEWQLSIKDKLFEPKFDVVILAIPPIQAANLLSISRLNHYLKASEMLPCYSLMLAIQADPPNWQDARLNNSILDKIVIRKNPDEAKPLIQVVSHANAHWSQSNIETDKSFIESELISHLKIFLSFSSQQIKYKELHRWRYAFPYKLNGDMFYDDKLNCGFIGDWTQTNSNFEGIDAALVSADNMAKYLMNSL